MSASAIADGLITTLSSTSVFGANTVSKNSYQVMESEVPIAAVIQWTNVVLRPNSFRTDDYKTVWNFQIECFVRDTNDPIVAMNQVWTYTDKLITCLRSDSTIQGTADALDTITGNLTPHYALSVGGQTWLPFTFNCEIVDLE